MKMSDQMCADIELRLVDGRPLTEDPELSAHVRSCLRCFRAASELRQVPQLAALLREAQLDDQPDPGDLFWAKFPRTVADAWERREQPAAIPTRVPAWRRVSEWFRLPIPAALSGAAVAAALVLMLVHRSPVTRPLAATSPAAPPVAAIAEAAVEEENPAGLLGEDDPLDSLELADTKLVARVAGAETQGSDEGSELSPSPAEELELLETDDLRAVAQALHGRSI
jgi:hypothetical protein